jgi:hypothetical protein
MITGASILPVDKPADIDFAKALWADFERGTVGKEEHVLIAYVPPYVELMKKQNDILTRIAESLEEIELALQIANENNFPVAKMDAPPTEVPDWAKDEEPKPKTRKAKK